MAFNQDDEKKISIFNATADTIEQLNTHLREATRLREGGDIIKYNHKLDSIHLILDSAMRKLGKQEKEDYEKKLKEIEATIITGMRKNALMKKQDKSSAGIILTVYENMKQKEKILREIREEVGLGLSFKGTDEDDWK